LTFALWGIHNYLTPSQNGKVIAKVNGSEIDQHILDITYRRVKRQQQIQLGADFTLSQKAASELKNRVLQDLIMQKVLSNAAREEGYYISSRQVQAVVSQIPAFQNNGDFSESRFQAVLQNAFYTPQLFFDEMSESLLIEQARGGYINTAFVLPNEVERTLALYNQKRDISYVLIKQDLLKPGIIVTPARSKYYYKKHQNAFRTPEKVQIQYLKLTIPAIMANINIPDKQLQTYYQQNLSSFIEPSGVHNGRTKSFKEVKKKVFEILARQQAEKKFADLSDTLANLTFANPKSLKDAAKQLHLPIQTTAFFTRKGLSKGIAANPKVIQMAFSEDVLEQGNNSELIELDSETVTVIRVNNHKPAAVKPYEEVKKEIEQKLINKEATTRAQTLGKKIQEAISSGHTLQAIARAYKLKVINKKQVSRYDNTINSNIAKTAFSLAGATVKNKPNVAGVSLKSGDYAVVTVTDINSKISPEQQAKKQDFARVLAQDYGLLDYNLYVQGQMQQAKIKKY